MITQDILAHNLAVVDAHFHSEAANEVEQALELYTDDIVWEATARQLVFNGKEAVAENYRKSFSSIENVEFRNLDRFAAEDRVVDDSILTFTIIREGFLPFPVGQRIEMRDGKICKEIAFEMPHPAP